MTKEKVKDMLRELVGDIDYDIRKEMFDYPEDDGEEPDIDSLLAIVSKYIKIEG